MCSTAPDLFESTDNHQVLQDPANEDWIALAKAIKGELFEVLQRRYYLVLYHLRKQLHGP